MTNRSPGRGRVISGLPKMFKRCICFLQDSCLKKKTFGQEILNLSISLNFIRKSMIF